MIAKVRSVANILTYLTLTKKLFYPYDKIKLGRQFKVSDFLFFTFLFSLLFSASLSLLFINKDVNKSKTKEIYFLKRAKSHQYQGRSA